ncbi:MAG: bifunctional diaminohydroxyphosphoribosylaminopyrimidine deaminase/5-amino-6-(5-phosphoribosylamino)uracil reductase RibD [Planctomycetaceae bacterium]
MPFERADQVFPDDASVMQHALRLAEQGIGQVEPNPAVGAVVVDSDRRLIAEGFHERFGEAHAEVNALAAACGRTQGHDLFVTLEPCCHHGKTPPCADAVIAAGFRRVVVGCIDPAPHTAGQGLARLRDAGIAVDVGLCREDAEWLIAPFRKLMRESLPWVHAKWAMTLDGRIATHTGHSQWISGADSRAEVHRLRGRMDAIITGAGTVRADDPLLTARPAGPRTALRVVVDVDGRSVRANGRLMSTLATAPVLICVAEEHAASNHVQHLASLGAEIHRVDAADPAKRIHQLLMELGRRKLTNVLVEAGAGLLGSFFDQQLVDEVHVFIAPKIVGGKAARSPVGGRGLSQIPAESSLEKIEIRRFEEDLLLEGRVLRPGRGRLS